MWKYKQWEKHQIVKKIVEHVLSRHLSLSIENVVVSADQLDFSLCHGGAGILLISGFNLTLLFVSGSNSAFLSFYFKVWCL